MKKDKSQLAKTIVFFAFVGIGVVILAGQPRISLPLIIAYVFSLMLQPLINGIKTGRLRKKILILLFSIISGFVVIYPVMMGAQTITDEAKKVEYYLPKAQEYLKVKFERIKKTIHEKYNYEINVDPVGKTGEFLQSYTQESLVYVPALLGTALEWGLLIPLFLFFMIKDGRKLRWRFVGALPNHLVEKAYNLVHQFNKKFGDYVLAKFIEASFVGAIITTGLVLLGYPFAFLLGLIAAITNILPYVGPIIGFIPALIIALSDPQVALYPMLTLYIVANVVDLAFVFPILVSKVVNLHPVVVVVSVVMGSQLWGAIGMILSIPLVACLKLILSEAVDETVRDDGLS